MNNFTDDDLKRLKDIANKDGVVYASGDEYNALLARLEAAEKALEHILALNTWTGSNNRKLVEAWRKTTGK